MTSPNFGINNIGGRHVYNDNLNCTWTITTDHGFYVTLEIDYFWVNNDKKTLISTTFQLSFIILA